MSLPLSLAALWVILASVAAMFPSRHNHWPTAYLLMVLALPLLIFVTYAHGPIIGALCLAGAMSVLRWPLIYFTRWLRLKLGA